jgi:outer membrane protein assembly factor BamB
VGLVFIPPQHELFYEIETRFKTRGILWKFFRQVAPMRHVISRYQLSRLWCVIGLACVILLGWTWSRTANRDRRSIVVSTDGQSTKEDARSDWPQLRGPNYDSTSTETGLADAWPDTGPPVLWTRDVGQGYSSFAAVGNRVFTQGQSLYQQYVMCLDAQTGAPIWTHGCGWPYEGGGLYPGPRSTPTWHEGRLYYATPDGTIGCLDAETGQAYWSVNPKQQHRGRGTDFGYACSPVIIGDRIIVPVGGLSASVVALATRDGSTIWTSGDAPASYASPLPIQWRERSLVVTPLENSIAAFDVASGRKEWHIESSEGYDEHSAAPLYREPFLLVASPFKAGAKQYRLDRNDAQQSKDSDQDGTRRVSEDQVEQSGNEQCHPVSTWESLKLSNDVASSVLVDGRVYGFDLKDQQSRLDRPSRGEFRCIDFESGHVIWSTDQIGQANAIVADQKLLLFNDRGELILCKLGTDEYTELARTQVFRDEICWTYPALHEGCVYLRTQTRAACLYVGATPYTGQRSVQSVQNIPRGRSVNAKWLIGGEREFPATVPEWSEFLVWYQWSLAALVLSDGIAILTLFIVRGSRSLRRMLALTPRSTSSTRATSSNSSQEPAPESLRPVLYSETRTGTATGYARMVYWLCAIVAGMIGSPLINSWQSEYVLLWPLILWAVFQVTINVIVWAERSSRRQLNRWVSRVSGLSFIGTCALYFVLCRSAGYAIEWSFLVGFLPAFPVAIATAKCQSAHARFWPATDLITSGMSFTAYFWLSVTFIKWKLVVGS